MIDVSKYSNAATSKAQQIKDDVLAALQQFRPTGQTEQQQAPQPPASQRKGCLAVIFPFLFKKKNHSPEQPDLSDLRRRNSAAQQSIVDTLRQATNRAHDDWSNFLKSQARTINADIDAQSDIDNAEKSRLQESVMAQSVLSFSMLDESSHIRSAENLSTPDGFDAYVASLRPRLEDAINKALSQQLDIYNRLSK